MPIAYDAIGNITGYDDGHFGYDLQWEHGRQLSSIVVDDGDLQHSVDYSYDLDGIRTKKVVNGVTHEYITQNGKVMRETIGTGSSAKVLDFIYDESGKPCALIYTNGTATPLTYYYVLNLQGDVVKLVNANGESRAEYTYNAWGEILSATGTMADINPLRYRSYYYDSETGWYYLQSRYYDPAMHRFINADSYTSTGQGFLGTNMFAYCNNNPVSFKDPNGEEAIAATIAVVVAVAIAVAGIAVTAYEIGELAVDGLSDISKEIEPEVFLLGAASIAIPLIKSATKEKEKTAVAEKTKQTYSYWEAYFVGKNVVLGKGLTLAEASVRVASGQNIMCRDETAAKAIIFVNGYWNAVGPEKGVGLDFYWHYHPHRNTSVHIWYLKIPDCFD